MFVSDPLHRESHFTMKGFCFCDSLVTIIICSGHSLVHTNERLWRHKKMLANKPGYEWMAWGVSYKRKIEEYYVSEFGDVSRVS